jgi:polysaccharide pyruvyl transferase WcaK-like protein
MADRQSKHEKKQICLFGLFGGGNYGNDGSLEAMLLVLQQLRPDAVVGCVCVDPQTIERKHRIPAVAVSWQGFSTPVYRIYDRIALRIPGRMANWIRALRYLQQFDVMIVAGTSTLCDYRSGPFGTPYGLFRWAVAARLCGVKLCFVSTGAGPILRPLSRRMLTYVARSAHYRSFRDQVSKDFIASLGINTGNDLVYPDLVFKLPVPAPLAMRRRTYGPVTIGVGVMAYHGWQEAQDGNVYKTYLAKIAQFIHSLLQRGHRVRLLIGEDADNKTVNDIGTILAAQGFRLKNSAPPNAEFHQFVAEPIESLHDIMRQIGDTDMVVATRFHNVICALKLSRPTISIGYEAKNEAVMTEMGLADFCQDIEDLDIERLNKQTTELLAQRTFYEHQIRQRLEQLQVRLRQQEEALMASVL